MKWCKIKAIKCLRKHVCELHESISEYWLWGQKEWGSSWPHRYFHLLLSKHQCPVQNQSASGYQELLTHLWNTFHTGKYHLFSIEYSSIDELRVWKVEREVFKHDQVRNSDGFPLKERIGGVVEIRCYRQDLDQIKEENTALLLWTQQTARFREYIRKLLLL